MAGVISTYEDDELLEELGAAIPLTTRNTAELTYEDEDDELLGADILGSQSVVAAPPTVSGGVPWQLMRTVALCAVGAVVGVGLGLAGLRRWDESPVMSNGSGSPYTADQFSWLVCFILVTPIGVVLSKIFSTQLYFLRNDSWCESTTRIKIAVRLVMVIVFDGLTVVWLAGVVEAYRRSQSILKCGVVFCIGPNPESPSSGTDGWRNVTGLGLFFVALSMMLLNLRFACVVMMELIRALRPRRRNRRGRRKRRPRALQPYNTRNRAAVCLWLLVGIPLLMAAAMVLPDSFYGFTLSGIRTNAAEAVGSELSPEVSSAPPGLTTHNWIIKRGTIVLKTWPDVLLFYGFLYVIALVGLLGRANRTVASILHWRPAFLRRISVGTAFVAVAFFVLVGLWIWYWGYAHIYNDDANMFHRERVARTLGQVSSLLMGLLLLPVSRNSVWVAIFGTSWESTIWVHKFLAYLFLGCTVAHMGTWWSVFAWGGRCDPRVFYMSPDGPIHPDCIGENACNATCRSGSCGRSCSSFPHDILPRGPMFYPSDSSSYPEEPMGDDWTISLVTVMFLIVALLCMGILGLNCVRRKAFELFWVAHWIAFPALVGAILFHAQSGWYYTLGGLVLWFLDHFLRSEKALRSVKVAAVVPHANHTELVLSVPQVHNSTTRPLRHLAGQYCFINIPRISPFEWHPFSIASAPQDSVSKFQIKNMGKRTFTGKLHSIACRVAAGDIPSPVLNVDGPYGLSPDVSKYNEILLVAGGIGITPIISLFRHLQQEVAGGATPCRSPDFSVRLVWTSRDANLFVMAADAVAEAAKDERFKISLHVTSGHRKSWESIEGMVAGGAAAAVVESIGGEPDVQLEELYEECIHEHRPNLQAELDALDPTGDTTLIFACGPTQLTDACSRLAKDAGVHFRDEVFLL